MVQKAKHDDIYVKVDKRDIEKFGGNLSLLMWYSKLKDYSRRFKPDKSGYIRIPPSYYIEDAMVDIRTIKRYNRQLEDKGLIEVDKIRRGGRTWSGFRIV